MRGRADAQALTLYRGAEGDPDHVLPRPGLNLERIREADPTYSLLIASPQAVGT